MCLVPDQTKDGMVDDPHTRSGFGYTNWIEGENCSQERIRKGRKRAVSSVIQLDVFFVGYPLLYL